MKLLPEEPPAGPWRVQPIADVVELLLGRRLAASVRPGFLGIDGRSSSGKTTLSERVRAAIPKSCVVHTDDIAWHHSRFGWADLLIEGIIKPVRSGHSVSYRPPEWDLRNRPGAIEVPAGISLLIVEGVGVGRRDLAQGLDALAWVQSDETSLQPRNEERVASGETSEEGVKEWMNEELPFLAEQRPWERANLIVAGTPTLPHDPTTEIVIANSLIEPVQRNNTPRSTPSP